ncbi:MAG: 2-dehydropantoate 2-reductase [Pseudohongiellaceae bacterium]
MTPGTPDWYVLGAGAMGCLWAARIHQHSANTILLLRTDVQAQAYETQGGLRLESHDTVSQIPVPAFAASTCTTPITQLLVATKAQDAIAALDSVKHLLTPDARIVMLQNGLKVQRAVSAAFDSSRVWCLSTSDGAWLRSPFHVVEAGRGETWLGRLHHAQADATLLQSLPAAAMGIRHDDNIENRLWRKLAANCAINALTALHDCRNGELLTRPEAHAELLVLVDEIATILNGLPDAPRIPNLHELVNSVLTATALNYSSTLQDVRRSRTTEIAHLNGYLCELAQAHDLDCTINQQILERFSALCKARGID